LLYKSEFKGLFTNPASSQLQFFQIAKAVDAYVHIVHPLAVDVANRYSAVVAKSDSLPVAILQDTVLVLYFPNLPHSYCYIFQGFILAL